MLVKSRLLTPQESVLQLGFKWLGLQERAGVNHNDKIVQMFHEIGHRWVTTDETAWCSCFVNWLAWSLKLKRSDKLDARSWLNVGSGVKEPLPGDIVVFWRERPDSWKGHVGVFVGFDEHKNIYCLGGNQTNEVNITKYSKTRLLGFRRLSLIKR